MSTNVVLIPGDGIGPEVAQAARRVIDATGADINWTIRHAGEAALAHGEASLLPQATLDLISECGVALKGPCTTPIGTGFRSVNVSLRKSLDLYAAVRPIRSMANVRTRYENVDLVIVRENTEGLYGGIEGEITKGVCTSTKVTTEAASRRIAEYAFRYCRDRGRRKLSVFHKANIMKLTDGMFIRCAREVHEANYRDIAFEEVIIDAGCMRMVQDPTRFDVILAENLYGDIMSDLCAGLVGGLGVTPGANIGEKGAVFEAVHGSAPDIAGKGVANPLALVMSGVMMLNWLSTSRNDPHFRACADRIRRAYDSALNDGATTRDLGGTLGTMEFAEALVSRMG
jgi:isocitrate dehydrogenase (NAD+)